MEIEKIVSALLPPACREHVLGDLSEGGITASDLFFTVPAVIWSQMRRAAPPSLLVAEALAAYVAYAEFAFFPACGRTALLTAVAPALAALGVLTLTDTYRMAKGCSWRSQLAISAMAAGFAGVTAFAVGVAPSRMILMGSLMAQLGIFTFRTALDAAQPFGRKANVGPLSLDQIRSRSEEFETEIRRRTLAGYVITSILAVAFGGYSLFLRGAMLRIGSALTVAGALVMLYQLWRKRLVRPPACARPTSYLQAFRAELARQLEFHGSGWFAVRLLSLLPGPMIFYFGFARMHPEAISFSRMEVLMFLAIAASSISLNLRMSRKYRRQMEQLTANFEELS